LLAGASASRSVEKMNRFAPILFIAVCLIGCGKGYHDFELGPKDFGPDTLLKVEKEMRLKLPAGTRGLNYYYKAPIDPAFIAKIEIPSNAKDDLVKQLSALPSKPIQISGGLYERVSWWTPTAANVLQDREFEDGTDYIYRRLILTEKDGNLLLYLYWATP
jgi:hypothetical protein